MGLMSRIVGYVRPVRMAVLRAAPNRYGLRNMYLPAFYGFPGTDAEMESIISDMTDAYIEKGNHSGAIEVLDKHGYRSGRWCDYEHPRH